MQEQLSTGAFTSIGNNRPATLDGWMAQPLRRDDDAVFAPPAEMEPGVVEKRPPLVLRILQSIGRAFMALCLSGASTNCVRCNAPVDRYAEIKGGGPSVSPHLSYRCRCCGQSWEDYFYIGPCC